MIVQILGWCFFPTIFFLQNAMAVVVAAGIGAWYFHGERPDQELAEPEIPACPAQEGFKWAFTSASGASFFCACVEYIIREIRKMADHPFKYCVCTPYTFAALVWCCIASVAQAFTKFTLIAHVFHGGGIRDTAQKTSEILMRRLGAAVVTDTIATLVLNIGTALISTGFALAAWYWLDNAQGHASLLDYLMKWAHESGSADVMFVLLVLMMYKVVEQPTITIVCLALFGRYSGYLYTATLDETSPSGTVYKKEFDVSPSGFLGGVFVGSVCCLFFRYFSLLVLNSADTIFYCFALESDYGQTQERFQKIYQMVNSVQVQANPQQAFNAAPMAAFVPAQPQVEMSRMPNPNMPTVQATAVVSPAPQGQAVQAVPVQAMPVQAAPMAPVAIAYPQV